MLNLRREGKIITHSFFSHPPFTKDDSQKMDDIGSGNGGKERCSS